MKVDLIRQNVAEIIYKLLQNKWSGSLNSFGLVSDCEAFAYDILDRVGEGSVVWLDIEPFFLEHAVFFLEGLYYDQENPNGVPSILDLEYVKRNYEN